MTEAIRNSQFSTLVDNQTLLDSLRELYPNTLQRLTQRGISPQDAKYKLSEKLLELGLTRRNIQEIDDAFYAKVIAMVANPQPYNLTREHGSSTDNDID